MRTLFWQLAAAVIFFVPLAFLRNLQGSPDWTRILGTGTLYLIYLLARAAGGWIYEHIIDGVPRTGDL